MYGGLQRLRLAGGGAEGVLGLARAELVASDVGSTLIALGAGALGGGSADAVTSCTIVFRTITWGVMARFAIPLCRTSSPTSKPRDAIAIVSPARRKSRRFSPVLTLETCVNAV